MSGGAFSYKQDSIRYIIEEIENEISKNNDESIDSYGDTIGRHFSDETISQFKEAITVLKKSFVYAQRIDWLLSYDDGEETFHERLSEELEAINKSELK